MQLLDEARTPLVREYPARIHLFTADAGIDPRLAAVLIPLNAHRQSRTVISDPSVGMLFGSFWEAGDSASEGEIADMAALAPDQSLIVIRDKVTLAGPPVNFDDAAPALWDSLACGISWVLLPSPDGCGPGLFAALGEMARRRNLDLPVYRHHVRRNPEEAERESGFPRRVRGLYVELFLTDARSRTVLSRRTATVPAHLAISGSIFFEEMAGGP